MTRRPPEVGTTDRTLFVWMLRAPSTLAVLWYTQVLPTAMGKEIEPVGTNAFEFAFGVVTGLAFALDEFGLVLDEFRLRLIRLGQLQLGQLQLGQLKLERHQFVIARDQ